MSKEIDAFECQGCWERFDWLTKSGKERRLPRVVVDCKHCGRLAEGPWEKREQLGDLAFEHREVAYAEMRRLHPDMPTERTISIVEGKMIFTPVTNSN